MQHQATSLEEIAKQTGLLINPQKKNDENQHHSNR